MLLNRQEPIIIQLFLFAIPGSLLWAEFVVTKFDCIPNKRVLLGLFIIYWFTIMVEKWFFLIFWMKLLIYLIGQIVTDELGAGVNVKQVRVRQNRRLGNHLKSLLLKLTKSDSVIWALRFINNLRLLFVKAFFHKLIVLIKNYFQLHFLELNFLQ